MSDTPRPPTGPAPGPAEEVPLAGLERSGARRALTPDEARRMAAKVHRVELAISLVLRVGVVASVLVIAVGLGLMFAHHGSWVRLDGPVSYRALTSATTSFPHSFGALGRALASGEGRGIVVLGVLILILTPVLRVAVGVISFAYEKDTPMALVTLFVLAVLVGSFFLAGA